MAARGRKPGLTPERYAEIQAELDVIGDRLSRLATEVANAHPRDSRPYRTAAAFFAPNAVHRMRNALYGEQWSRYPEPP